MNRKGCLLWFAAMASAGVVAAEVVLPETLAVGWINSPEALAQVGYCIPDITPEKLDELRARTAKAIVVQFSKRSDTAPYLVATEDRFACIDRNGKGKPVLPARVFGKMIQLEGAAEQTGLSLYQSLARQIATRGVADALVKFPNGNAIELSVSVVEDAPVEFLYSTNFLKAGEYDETKYRFVVSDQIKSFSTTSYGSAGRRAVGILQDELAPRPLRGEFLLAVGNGPTEAYRFQDTNWRFASSGAITLAAGGVVNFKPKAGEGKTGAWEVDNGVLYFNYGQVYGSATLDKDDKLAVEFRSPQGGPMKKERRWTASLEKTFF